jgi:hypothetical protein
VQALNYLRDATSRPAILVFQLLKMAAELVRGGLSIDAAAARVELPPAEVQHYIDRKNRPPEENPWLRAMRDRRTDDDVNAPWDAATKKLVADYSVGGYIDIGSETIQKLHPGAVAGARSLGSGRCPPDE